MPVLATYAAPNEAGAPLFQAAGWIEPRPTAIRVAALAPGVIESLFVVEDQHVQAGDPIAKLIETDAKLSYDGALADLALREAELAEAKAELVAAETRYTQPVHLDAALGEADAALAKIDTELKNLPFTKRRAEAEREAAQRDVDGKIAAKGAVPKVALAVAESKLHAAIALVEELSARKPSLTAERAAIASRRDALKTQRRLRSDELRARDSAAAQLQAVQARVEQARIQVAIAALQRERMTIRAPVDGRVYRLVATPGARVGSGTAHSEGKDSSTIVTLYRPESLQVRVDVRFENLQSVGLNQPVEIDNPALPEPIRGAVLSLGSEADIQKNTLEVKVAIANAPELLKPEMLVDITFLAVHDPKKAAESPQIRKVLIPQRLVRSDESGSFVWVADVSHSKAKKARIETSPANSQGLVEVRSGLKITSRLVVGGSESLTDGMRIRILGEAESAAATNGGSDGSD